MSEGQRDQKQGDGLEFRREEGADVVVSHAKIAEGERNSGHSGLGRRGGMVRGRSLRLHQVLFVCFQGFDVRSDGGDRVGELILEAFDAG